MRQVWPSSSMCMPLRNWLVETTSAIGGRLPLRSAPWGTREQLDAVLRRRSRDPRSARRRARAGRSPARPSRRCPPASVSVDSVESRGASWTASPTPWPSPWPKFSPKPAAAISSRASASASTPVMPGRIAGARLLLGREADVVGLDEPRRAAEPVDRSGCSPSSSRRPARPSRRRRASGSRRSCRSASRAAARRSGRTRRSRSNDTSSAPCACSSSRSRQASSRSLRPTNVSAVSASNARSAMRAARRTRCELVRVLDGAEALDDRRSSARASPCRRSGSATRCTAAPPPRTAPSPSASGRARRAATRFVERHLDVGHLARRLDVAEVGVERRLAAGLHEQRGVRAVEARQIDDVDEVGDEQRLRRATRPAPPGVSLIGPPPCRRGTRAPRGSRPGPCRSPGARRRRRSTLCRRHSSRASMFDRCTSTSGTSSSSSASRIA